MKLQMLLGNNQAHHRSKHVKKGLLVDAEILEHNEKSSPLILLSYASHFGDKYQHVLRYGVKKAEGPSYSNKFGSWVDNTPFPTPHPGKCKNKIIKTS